MIKVHHLNNSRSHRVLWLLEELGQPYEIVHYKRSPVFAPAELKGAHPLGKSPVIEDGALKLAESGAIVEYLIARYGAGKLGRAPTDKEWPQYIEWLHYAEGSAMLPLLLGFYAGPLGEAAAPLLPRIMSEVETHLGFVSKSLGDRPFLMGADLTGADILMSFVLQATRASMGLAPWPNLGPYLDRLEARPAYARALEKGGPFEIPKAS